MYRNLFSHYPFICNQQNGERLLFHCCCTWISLLYKVWKPKENKKLDCSHEEHNPFDWFAVKTVTSDGLNVGHLPGEILRITKFFFDRGAVMQVELTSKHYRRSPLVKGGMKIACLVRVRIPATLKNTKLAEKYLELVRESYTKPKNEETLCCFVTNIGTDMEKEIPAAGRKRDQRKRREVHKKKQTDIAVLGVTAQVSSSKKRQNGV